MKRERGRVRAGQHLGCLRDSRQKRVGGLGPVIQALAKAIQRAGFVPCPIHCRGGAFMAEYTGSRRS